MRDTSNAPQCHWLPSWQSGQFAPLAVVALLLTTSCFGSGDADMEDAALADVDWDAADQKIAEQGEVGTVGAGDVPEQAEVFDVLQGSAMDVSGVVRAKNCEELEQLWRMRLVRHMEAGLAEARWLLQVWSSGGCPDTFHGFDLGFGSWEAGDQHPFLDAHHEAAAEPDMFAHNDGHLYVATGDKVNVLDVSPASSSHVIGWVAVPPRARRLLLVGERLLVFSSVNEPPVNPYALSSCTAEPNEKCELPGHTGHARVTVLDVADPSKPKVIRDITFAGNYVDARVVGGVVYIIARFGLDQTMPAGVQYAPLPFQPYLKTCNFSQIPKDELVVPAFEAQRKKNVDLILNAPLKVPFPSVEDLVVTPSGPVKLASPFSKCAHYAIDTNAGGSHWVAVLALDPTEQQPLVARVTTARPGAVLASKESLYLTAAHRVQKGASWYFRGPPASAALAVHKLHLGSTASQMDWQASAVLENWGGCRIALAEADGRLRLATTSGVVSSGVFDTTIAVLESVDDQMKVLGQVHGFAGNQRVVAMRQDGDKALLVTSDAKSSSLTTVDVSDPKSPAVIGKYNIGGPAYRALSLGSKSLAVLFQKWSPSCEGALRLAMLDAAVPTMPSELWQMPLGQVFPGPGPRWSDVALTWWPDSGLLAVPALNCASYPCEDPNAVPFDGLQLYRMHYKEGISTAGGVNHLPGTPSTEKCQGGACGAATRVEGSVIIDGWVLSIGVAEVRVATTNAPGKLVAKVALVP